jgi:fibrillarin-like pre-rRNA processing protein
MDPKSVVAQEAKKIEKRGFNIEQIIDLKPFDKDHALVYAVYYPK